MEGSIDNLSYPDFVVVEPKKEDPTGKKASLYANPTVHRLDAARLYRLALENAAPGARYHGSAEEAITVKTIAEAIGQQLKVQVVSISAAYTDGGTWTSPSPG